MPSLKDNLEEALEEAHHRLTLLKEQGPDAISLIYPHLSKDAGGVYQDLLRSLPKEIERLRWRIRDLS